MSSALETNQKTPAAPSLDEIRTASMADEGGASAVVIDAAEDDQNQPRRSRISKGWSIAAWVALGAGALFGWSQRRRTRTSRWFGHR